MFVIFVSHQWLGRQHPDPMGEQLLVLQGVLKNIISRKLKIESDIVSQYYGRRPTKGELRRTAKAHVWLDYFSVPQLVDGHEPGVPEEQLLHVRSIPSYVDCCNIFLALVPDATHSETLSQCNFHSWLERGWCRTELWSYSLSARSKIPIVVVKSQDVAQFAAPLWHRYPVHLGDFAVEKDRASCSTVIQTALTEHLGELSQVKNKTAYRLYRSLFEEMTGLARKQRSLEEFLSDFSFSNHLHRHKGLGPIACAALSGDHVLVHTLAVAKASLQTSAPALPQTLNASGYSPLHLAVWFRSHDLRMLETLLKLRADPSSSSLTALPPLGLCSTVEALELLVRHGAGINDQGNLAKSAVFSGGFSIFAVPGCAVPSHWQRGRGGFRWDFGRFCRYPKQPILRKASHAILSSPRRRLLWGSVPSACTDGGAQSGRAGRTRRTCKCVTVASPGIFG